MTWKPDEARRVVVMDGFAVIVSRGGNIEVFDAE